MGSRAAKDQSERLAARANPRVAMMTDHLCTIHVGRESECPRAHICVCGATLADHMTVAAYCPRSPSIESYRPSPETLARFPSEYDSW